MLIVLSADLSFHVSHFDLSFANSSSKAPLDDDKGDSLQRGEEVLFGAGHAGSWEDPLNDSANRRECTKHCLDGGIGPPIYPPSFPGLGLSSSWTTAAVRAAPQRRLLQSPA